MAGKEFIIFVEYGGLGDHLFFSHLPRVAKSLGYERVLLSSQSPFRSEDTRRLVWEGNPYFDGFIDVPGSFKPRFASVPENMNLLDRMMLDLGLDDGKRWHEPEVSYKPKIRSDAVGMTILDPNFISFVGDVPPSGLEAYLRKNKIQVDAQLVPRDKTASSTIQVEQITTKDLWDYCDLIHSCERFLCFTSGGATLAAALKKPALAFYGPGQYSMFHHSPQHRYVQLNADGTSTEKRAGPDLSVQEQEQ